MKTVTLQNNIVISDFIVACIILHNCGKGKIYIFTSPKHLSLATVSAINICVNRIIQ